MKAVLFIVCLISSLNWFSQDINDSLIKNYVTDTSKPILYCGIGAVPLVYRKEDKSFEKQYKVKYTIVGCVPEYPVEVMLFHNRSIAQFLDRKFGLRWRSGLRPDVLGITN